VGAGRTAGRGRRADLRLPLIAATGASRSAPRGRPLFLFAASLTFAAPIVFAADFAVAVGSAASVPPEDLATSVRRAVRSGRRRRRRVLGRAAEVTARSRRRHRARADCAACFPPRAPPRPGWTSTSRWRSRRRYRGLLPVRDLVLQQSVTLARIAADHEAAEARNRDLEKLERLRAQFLAHSTHELRSPVNAIVFLTAAKILLVDDDTAHLTVTKELLEAEGYDVVVHVGAFGATEKVLIERPALVLVDVNMPALSGEGLVTVLRGRAQTRDTRVMLYSSNDEDALRGAAERLQIAGYVCKGDPGELRRKVARALRASSPETSVR
jgi:CheY-like chemotaxis protein